MTPPKPHGYEVIKPDGWPLCVEYAYEDAVRQAADMSDNEIQAMNEIPEGWHIRPVMLVSPEYVEWVEKTKAYLLLGWKDSRKEELLAELEKIEKEMK